MKHLVAELLQWRDKRRSLRRKGSVDAALQTPLLLVSSSKHNDMVLCSPIQSGAPPQPAAIAASPMADQIGSSPAKVFFAHCGESSSQREQQLQQQQEQQRLRQQQQQF